MNAKQSAANTAVEYIKNGMTLGLGTGSTAYWAIEFIGKKIKEGLNIRAISTSIQTETLASSLGIPIVGFSEIERIDITIDGADEVDENLQIMKGGGGALLREKIVAAATEFYIIIIDHTKLVRNLGKFKLPVEVIPFGWEITTSHLKKIGCEPIIRLEKEVKFVTDNGNYIVDCSFGSILSPAQTHEKINAITGVVDNGLFINMADLVVAGYDTGNTKKFQRKSGK